MSATQPKAPGESAMSDLEGARQMLSAAQKTAFESGVMRDALAVIVNRFFVRYCLELFSYSESLNAGTTFWLTGEYEGEYKILDRDKWPNKEIYMNVGVTRYSKRGKRLQSSNWETMGFLPKYLLENALFSKPVAATGSPP